MNHFGRGWDIIIRAGHNRLPNGILGVLCRRHYPGFVMVAEGDGAREKLVTAWEDYVSAPDQPDREGRNFGNKAARVVAEFWVSLSRNKLYFSIRIINWMNLNY